MSIQTQAKLDLKQSVSSLPKVGPKLTAKLGKLGIKTVRDLLFHFPRKWLDLTSPKTIKLAKRDQLEVLGGTLDNIKLQIRRGRTHAATEAILTDGEGSKLRIIWLNQPYLATMLTSGQKVILVGTIKWSWRDRAFIMWNPKIEYQPRIISIYPETENLNSKYLSKLLSPLLESINLPNVLTSQEQMDFHSVDLAVALRSIHEPKNLREAIGARNRLAVDELINLIYRLTLERRQVNNLQSPSIKPEIRSLQKLTQSLPFELTPSQKIVSWSIIQSMESSHPIDTLIQGDVGSGKTITAALCTISVLKSGYHVLWMAPTQVLALQLYERLQKTLKPLKLTAQLIMSGLKKTGHFEQSSPTLFVGTHALLNLPVEGQKIGLVVVDEQHRFGVKQREALFKQSVEFSPHVITMTATPIPRSLALSVYGDMKLCVIKERPVHQSPIKTVLLSIDDRKVAADALAQEIKSGRQGFIVFPRIQNRVDGTIFGKFSIEEIKAIYQELLPGASIDIFHGQLKEEEKAKIIKQFSDGQLNVLVATSIIEVGIDIPNATIMIIEEAELFGLAQLHQIRGRVGRGQAAGTCFVIRSANDAESSERMAAFANCYDGFQLAEIDLGQRGAGDLLGTEQSGLPPLRIARLDNWDLASTAKTIAERLINHPPEHLKEWLELYE